MAWFSETTLRLANSWRGHGYVLSHDIVRWPASSWTLPWQFHKLVQAPSSNSLWRTSTRYHRYKLASHVVVALLPVYHCLSQPQLLERCRGKKAQNAAESPHSVIRSVLPKDENATLSAAETRQQSVKRFVGLILEGAMPRASSVLPLASFLEDSHFSRQQKKMPNEKVKQWDLYEK